MKLVLEIAVLLAVGCAAILSATRWRRALGGILIASWGVVGDRRGKVVLGFEGGCSFETGFFFSLDGYIVHSSGL